MGGAIAVATGVDVSTGPKTTLEKDPGRGSGITVFIADHDPSWQSNYKSALGPIVGLENITIVGDYTQSINYLKSSSVYVIDPSLPMSAGMPKEDYGLDIIDKIRAMEGNSDAIWVLSENHDLLRTAGSKDVRQIYTKKQTQTEGYPTSDVFLEKLVKFLGRGRDIGSDEL